jgi:co-chaperonin GroES (HSP10)
MENIKFNPTRDWVLLPFPDVSKTESGIIVPASAERNMRKNILKVIKTGPDCQKVKSGDTVMVHPQSDGLIIEIPEGKFVMVNEFMICGIIPEE